MQFRKISERVSVSPQLCAEDVAAAAAAGFKSLICNRPDGEAMDQPGFADIERAAKDAGLVTRYLPVVSGRMTEADVIEFGQAIDALPGPVLAYCRSGTRCATLWALDQRARGADAGATVAAARNAGYDLSSLLR